MENQSHNKYKKEKRNEASLRATNNDLWIFLVKDTTTTAVVGSTPEPGNCPAGWEAFMTSCFLFEPDMHLVRF